MEVATTEPSPLAQRRSAYHWVILLVAVVCQTGLSIPGQGIPTLGYFLQTDMALSRVEIGMFATVMSGGSVLSLIAFGWLADRIGVRRLLLVGLITMGIFVILMGFSPSFLLALLFLVPVGFGSGMINPPISKAIMYWFPPRMRGTAMGIKQTGVPLGGAIAAATLPTVAIAFGWRVGVIGLGVAIAAAGIAVYCAYREYPKPAKAVSTAPGLGFRGALRVLASRDLLLASIAVTPLVATQFVVVTYFLLYLKEVLLFPVVQAGLFLSLTQLSGIGGRVFWGVASDFLFGGSRRKTMVVIMIMATAVVGGVAALPVGAPAWLVAALAVGLGATVISWHGVQMAQIGELAGKELSGTAIGFSLTISQLGIMVGPPFFGFVVDQSESGSYRLAWFIMAALSALSVALLLALRGPKRPA